MGMSWKCEPWEQLVSYPHGVWHWHRPGSSLTNHATIPCPSEPLAAEQGCDGWQSIPWTPWYTREKLAGE